jgi:hypothetical protein
VNNKREVVSLVITALVGILALLLVLFFLFELLPHHSSG